MSPLDGAAAPDPSAHRAGTVPLHRPPGDGSRVATPAAWNEAAFRIARGDTLVSVADRLGCSAALTTEHKYSDEYFGSPLHLAYAIAARKLRASIHSNGISLAPASAADETRARLFGRTPLVPRWLPGLNGVLDVQLERLHYAGTDASAISASAVFDPSRLEIAIRAAFGDGVLTLDGTHAYAAGETRITAAANAVELDRIAPVRQYLSGAKLDATAELGGRGHTGHELVAGLGGRVRAQIGRGTLNHVKLELLSQNLLAMTLLSVIPFQHPAPRTPLECAALRLDLARGRTGTEAVPVIVARSDKLLLIGRGTLDLGTEQIALKLQPARHTALTLDAPGNPRTVSINGPLRAPVVKSSAGDWLHESLAIGASLATNPLARAANKVFARNKAPRTSCAAVLDD